MTFTDNSDFFSAVHENGFNQMILNIMHQRPSMFNYATKIFTEKPELFCVPIEAAGEVSAANNPLFAEQKPLPILGSTKPLGLNWCLQLTDLQIDFHPNNVVELPDELIPLQHQQMALQLQGYFGLGCPPDDYINWLLPKVEIEATKEKDQSDDSKHISEMPREAPEDVFVLAAEKMICSQIELNAVLYFEWGTIGDDEKQQWLKIRLNSLEIVDLAPNPVEIQVEHYISMVLQLGVLPRLSIKMESLMVDITKKLKQDFNITVDQQITVQPTSTTTRL